MLRSAGQTDSQTKDLHHKKTGFRFNGSFLLYGLLSGVTAGVLLFAAFRPVLVLPRIRLAPGFVMHDLEGQLINSEAFRGRITLYTFTFAGCAESNNCPYSTADLEKLHRYLQSVDTGGIELSLVTILLDTDNSGPQNFALSTNKPVEWVFLNGDRLTNRYVVGDGFQVYFDELWVNDGTSSRLPLAPKMVLVDGLGIIRAEYLNPSLDSGQFERDINLLVKETQSTGPAARIGYEAAHLFVCYP